MAAVLEKGYRFVDAPSLTLHFPEFKGCGRRRQAPIGSALVTRQRETEAKPLMLHTSGSNLLPEYAGLRGRG